jgi:hypothetical protein
MDMGTCKYLAKKDPDTNGVAFNETSGWIDHEEKL